MERKHRYPRYISHDDASCEECGGDLMGTYWSKSGKVSGNGEFLQSCEKCRVTNWYDLKRVVLPAIGRNNAYR